MILEIIREEKTLNWAIIRYFKPNHPGMTCPCGCGRCEMDHDYMMRLDWLRRNLGFPLPVNSGFRCPDYDIKISGAGVHPTGHGIDVRIYGYRTHQLIALAPKAGFTGIGISQKGKWIKRFIHLDDLPNIQGIRPRPWVWSY